MGKPTAADCWEGVGKSFAEKLNWARASKGLDASESPGSAPALVTCWVTLRKSHSLSEPVSSSSFCRNGWVGDRDGLLLCEVCPLPCKGTQPGTYRAGLPFKAVPSVKI